MDPLLTSVLSWAVTSLLAAGVGGIVATVKSKSSKDEALELGMRTLMRRELIRMHEQYVQSGNGCPVRIKDQASQVYRAYHDLGGNGTGTQLYNEIMEAHVKED